MTAGQTELDYSLSAALSLDKNSKSIKGVVAMVLFHQYENRRIGIQSQLVQGLVTSCICFVPKAKGRTYQYLLVATLSKTLRTLPKGSGRSCETVIPVNVRPRCQSTGNTRSR